VTVTDKQYESSGEHPLPPPLSASGCPVLHGAGFAARPQEVYSQLRAAGPAGWAEIAPGVNALVVTRYHSALTVLNDTSTYAKDSRHWKAMREGHVPQDSPVRIMLEWHPSALYADGEVHARLRRAIDDCLVRINPHRLKEVTRRSALSLISEVAEQGHCDLMTDFADMLPLLVFADLLGCPQEFTGRLVHAFQGVISAGPGAPGAALDVAALLDEIIRIKHREPGDDVTSWILAHPAALTDEETLHQLFMFVGAGTLPTAGLIGWALHLLLREDPYAGNLTAGTLTVRRAMEKVLWTRSPMANFAVHYARHDTQLDGVPVPAGVPVLISHAAANTDPELSPGIGYANRSHLAWSAGPHRCPAISQATTIAETGIETVFDRLWDMELAVTDEEITLRHGPFHHCPVALPATFRPKSAAGMGSTAAGTGTASAARRSKG
jgi:cytochrome P450